jgi:hypothetical protein
LPSLARLPVNRCQPCDTGVKLVYDDNTDCSICLNPVVLTNSDPRIAQLDDAELQFVASAAASLSCGHVFHTRCLRETFSRLPVAQWACPNDRQPLITADVQHLQTATNATAARAVELQAIRERMLAEAERARVNAERLAILEASAQARDEEERLARERELANDDEVDSEFLERLVEFAKRWRW